MPAYPLIFGASGLTGTEIVKLLSKARINVRVSYREQSELNTLRNFGAEPIFADYSDPESVSQAMIGVSAAALILPISPNMGEWGRLVVNCAKKSGLPKLVVFSNLGASPDSQYEIPRMHGEILAHLRESGVPYQIVQCAPFFQNLFWSVLTIVRQRGFSLPLGNAELPYIDLHDAAVFTAKVLCEDRPESHTHRITGPQSLSMFRIARRLSTAIGHDIRYTPIEPENGGRVFRSMGLTSWLSQAISDMHIEYASGKYKDPTGDFKALMGRAPTGLDNFISRNLMVFRRDEMPEFTLEN